MFTAVFKIHYLPVYRFLGNTFDTCFTFCWSSSKWWLNKVHCIQCALLFFGKMIPCAKGGNIYSVYLYIYRYIWCVCILCLCIYMWLHFLCMFFLGGRDRWCNILGVCYCPNSWVTSWPCQPFLWCPRIVGQEIPSTWRRLPWQWPHDLGNGLGVYRCRKHFESKLQMRIQDSPCKGIDPWPFF